MSKGLDALNSEQTEYILMMYCITTNRLYEFLVLSVIDFNILFSLFLSMSIALCVYVHRQWNVNAWKRIWMRLNKTRESEKKTLSMKMKEYY